VEELLLKNHSIIGYSNVKFFCSEVGASHGRTPLWEGPRRCIKPILLLYNSLLHGVGLSWVRKYLTKVGELNFGVGWEVRLVGTANLRHLVIIEYDELYNIEELHMFWQGGNNVRKQGSQNSAEPSHKCPLTF
jgi:hypothetical protein